MFRTLGNAVTFRGVGLHCGLPVCTTIAPAAPGSGIAFRRVDAGPSAPPVPARYNRVTDTRYRTSLGNGDGLTVCTVEHLLAALSGCGVTDASVALDGPEVPVLDGSAVGFVRGILGAGFREVPGPARAIRIVRPVCVHMEGRFAALLPAPRSEMRFTVRFDDPAIGEQTRDLVLTRRTIVGELSDSRTFSLLSDVPTLRRMGLGRGGGLDNAIVVDRGRILNPEGLRHPDEFVRHKMLDAVGDLALAGAPIIGRYVGFKAGHEVTNRLLRQLFAEPAAWTWCEVPDDPDHGAPIEAPPIRLAAVPAVV